MTSRLMHNVTHFTRPSFRPKTNNQPIKKVLSLKGHLSKSSQKLDAILENKVVFKLKLSKNVNNKLCAPRFMFFDKKNWNNFGAEN